VANVDQIADDLRARLHVIASDIGAFAIGHGAWRAPDQVYHGLEILEGRLQRAARPSQHRIRQQGKQHLGFKWGSTFPLECRRCQPKRELLG
jgi:hypothetical protein